MREDINSRRQRNLVCTTVRTSNYGDFVSWSLCGVWNILWCVVVSMGQAPSEWSEIFGTYIRTNLILSANIYCTAASAIHSTDPTTLVGLYHGCRRLLSQTSIQSANLYKVFSTPEPLFMGEDCMAQGSQCTMGPVYNGRGIDNPTRVIWQSHKGYDYS